MKNIITTIAVAITIIAGQFVSGTNTAKASPIVEIQNPKGNKNVETKDIWVKNFDKIKIEVDAEVHYYQSESESGIKITIDENLFELINATVDVNTLTIKLYQNVKLQPSKFVIEIYTNNIELISNKKNATIEFKTEINVKELKIENKGNGKIFSMKSTEVKDLEVENIGNGTITLVGKADNARIFLSGAGKINMENYAIRNCTCENSGAGDIYIYASKQLDCMLFGKGNIYYMGDPEIKKDIPGVGKLIKR